MLEGFVFSGFAVTTQHQICVTLVRMKRINDNLNI